MRGGSERIIVTLDVTRVPSLLSLLFNNRCCVCSVQWCESGQARIVAAPSRLEAPSPASVLQVPFDRPETRPNLELWLLELRNLELVRLRKYFITSALSVTMFSSAPLLVALATFSAYTLAGNTLDVAEALTALALFDILRFPLFMLPQIINRIVEAGISFERVREFLLCEEYKSVGEGTLKETGEVWMKNGTFVYGESSVVYFSISAEIGTTF